ncbi:MAG TPA: hypothetical protein VGF89_13735 [Steroidobacteraceae bacterium]|jgi:hypothetical protein
MNHRFSQLLLSVAAVTCLGLSACGGGSSVEGTSATGTTQSDTGNGGSSPPAGAGSTSSSSSSSSSGGASSASAGSSSAAALAAKLGLPSRLLLGLGAQANAGTASQAMSQNLTVDIDEHYLVGVGSGDWTTWLPNGAFIDQAANEAQSLHAVPMFTLYGMAANGDGNLSGLSNSTFMTAYWANARLLFQKLGALNRPSLVNFEPDFWGYAEQHSTNGDPTTVFAYVNGNSECAGLSNNVIGVAGCLIAMARKYAPQAYVGFPPSDWGGTNQNAVIAYMNKLGTQHADFITMQTLDRDAGCFEANAAASSCAVAHQQTWYLDETNTTTPNYAQAMDNAQGYHDGIGGLPLIWWQTPMGVPSSTPGGTANHYRDNHVHYFLTHASELTAVGSLAVVFGTGNDFQTSIATDGGQFQSLSSAYLASPAVLP